MHIHTLFERPNHLQPPPCPGEPLLPPSGWPQPPLGGPGGPGGSIMVGWFPAGQLVGIEHCFYGAWICAHLVARRSRTLWVRPEEAMSLVLVLGLMQLWS